MHGTGLLGPVTHGGPKYACDEPHLSSTVDLGGLDPTIEGE
jgi:hypothetical protein